MTCIKSLFSGKLNDNLIYILTTSVTFIFIFLGLFIWSPSPFYPDELAFRMGSARYIQNNYSYLGLYPYCFTDTPLLALIFIPSAWVLSFLNNTFSPVTLRLLPLIAIVITILGIFFIACLKNKIKYFPIVSLICIGVAGSGLILNRYEYLLIAQIGTGLISISLYEKGFKVKIFTSSLIIFLSLTNVLTHPQGLLFLPFTGFCIYKLWNPSKFKNKIFFLFIFILSFSSIFLLSPHRTGCTNFPDVDFYFSKMVTQPSDFKNINIKTYIYDKIQLYSSSFLYKKDYLVNYIPGVIDHNNSAKLSSMNLLLIGTVVTIFLISFTISLCFIHSLVINNIYFLKNKNKDHSFKIYYLLLVLPAFFLFMYDKNQYFYRTFFINFILVITLTFAIINSQHNKFTKLLISLSVFSLIICGLSFILNYKLFYYMLPSWGAIATTPQSNISNQPIQEIEELVKLCNIPINKGGLIVDAYTYEYFKKFSNITDVYYVSNGYEMTHESIPKISKLIGASHVISSCKGMERTKVGWPADFIKNNICCSTLIKAHD